MTVAYDITRTARPNRYAGPCAHCGGWVPANAGVLVSGRNGRWAAGHVVCPAEPVARPARPSQPDVAAGYYAIVDATGRNDLRFYRVDRPTEGRWAGYTFVKEVIGGHADQRVARDAVDGILAAITADPEAGPRYGREIGRCYACHRHLTDEVSRAAGIGPDCATRR